LNVLVFGLDWTVDGVVDESGVGVCVWVKTDSVVFNVWWVLNGVVDASVNTFLDLESSSVTFVLAWSKSVPLTFRQWIDFGSVTSWYGNFSLNAIRDLTGTWVLHASLKSTITALTVGVSNFNLNELCSRTVKNSFYFHSTVVSQSVFRVSLAALSAKRHTITVFFESTVQALSVNISAVLAFILAFISSFGNLNQRFGRADSCFINFDFFYESNRGFTFNAPQSSWLSNNSTDTHLFQSVASRLCS
jgi:hypothetical protein